jgi:hypothetical protein
MRARVGRGGGVVGDAAAAAAFACVKLTFEPIKGLYDWSPVYPRPPPPPRTRGGGAIHAGRAPLAMCP